MLARRGPALRTFPETKQLLLPSSNDPIGRSAPNSGADRREPSSPIFLAQDEST